MELLNLSEELKTGGNSVFYYGQKQQFPQPRVRRGGRGYLHTGV